MKVVLIALLGVACGVITYVALRASEPAAAAVSSPPLPHVLVDPLERLELALDLDVRVEVAGTGEVEGSYDAALTGGPLAIELASATASKGATDATLASELSQRPVQDLLDGSITRDYHGNGQLAFLGTRILDDQNVWIRHGDWEAWHSNGQSNELGRYENGVEDGNWQWWWENGKRMAEGRFHKGEREGDWTFWFEDGSLMMRASYRGGEGVGRWTSYHENGLKWTEGSYVNGLISGHWNVWLSDGSIDTQRTGWYEEGTRVRD